MSTIGIPDNPLRVAIIGSGPSGFYAAEHLLKQKDLTVQVDMFERLPTPFGLVRGGVAPDHQKIKSVTKVYERIAEKPNFRFFGHVEFGKDITRADIESLYHAVIYAVGAQSDRKLNIPGEDLPGSHPATEFVAWYNAHPDYRDLKFDLTQENVAVIGVGNVAMDVARILARSVEELRETDIADYALDALAQSRVTNIYILGRRGPAQAKFTNAEIKEFGEMADADVIVAPEEVELDPLSQAYLESDKADKTAIRNVEILREYAQRQPAGKRRKVIFRFLVSPVEIIGDERVEAIKVVHNELYQDDRGNLRPRATDRYETIPVGLVFRSVGYRGVPLPDVPFREDWGTIPNDKGRVLTAADGEVLRGHYVAGWIKRGPSGVIGTNKPDSVETVEQLLADREADALLQPANTSADAVIELLKSRGVRYVTFDDWKRLDELELKRGEAAGRPRLKFSSVEEMLAALDSETMPQAGD
ncbi:MAG: NADP oxidoreductase [Chloroflexi bacterium]|nr:MAG: NADP oxidoreductase [Chloroflexota bacterium]